MIEAGGNKTRPEKHDAVAEGDQEEERACFLVPNLQVLLDCGQQGRQDDPGHKVQEEYFYEKEDGRELGKERDVRF